MIDLLKLIFCIAIPVVVCWVLPRKCNKYLYKKYGLINPINLVSNLIMLAIFIVLSILVILMSSFISNDINNNIIYIIIGIIYLLCGIFASSAIFNQKDITLLDIIFCVVMTLTSMAISLLSIYCIFETLRDKKKSTVRKAGETLYYGFGLFALAPDLSNDDILRLDEDIIKHKDKYSIKRIEKLKEKNNDKEIYNSSIEKNKFLSEGKNSAHNKKELYKEQDYKMSNSSYFKVNNEKVVYKELLNRITGKYVDRGYAILTKDRLIYFKNCIFGINLDKYDENKKNFDIKNSDIKSIRKGKHLFYKTIIITTNSNEEYIFYAIRFNEWVYYLENTLKLKLN